MSQMRSLLIICHINLHLYFALQKLDKYLHDSEFVIITSQTSQVYHGFPSTEQNDST